MKPRIAIPVPNSKRRDYVLRALPQYEQAVRAAGGEPVVIDVKGTNSEIAQAVKRCDGVLLPGSPADVDPEKYGAQRHPGTAPRTPCATTRTSSCFRMLTTCASRSSASAMGCSR